MSITKQGSEFIVNTTTAGGQSLSDVATLSNGNFVEVWLDSGVGLIGNPGYVSPSYKGQLFDSNGTKIGNEITILSDPSATNPISVWGTSNGGFVAAYDFLVTAGPAQRLQLQFFDASGASASFQTETANTFAASNTALTTLSDGTVVAAWNYGPTANGEGVNNNSSSIFAKIGTGTQFLVNTTVAGNQNKPTIATLANGDFVIAWNDDSGANDPGIGIKGQVFHSNGTKLGAEFVVDTATNLDEVNPSIAALPNGGFIACWNHGVSTPNSTGSTRAQIFDNAGNKVGNEITVDNGITDNRNAQQDVAVLGNGEIVIVWTEFSQSGSPTTGDGDNGQDGIKAQLLDASGNKIGIDFVVNNHIAGEQTQPYVTALPNNKFVVTWTDASGADGDGAAVKSRIFSSNVNGDFNGDSFGDILIQNPGTGQIAYGNMAGGVFQGWANVSTTPGFTVVGKGRIAGDASSDVVIQSASGVIAYANLVNGAFSSWLPVANTPGWSAIGVGDVNGDGFADVVIQSQSSGQIAYANMFNGAFAGLPNVGTTPGWSAKAVADVNGDGFADVVIQNTTSGQIAYGNMLNGTLQGWVNVGTTPGWNVAGTGDINGDGFVDIVIQNQASGQIAYGNMLNGSLQSWVNVATTPGFNVTAVEDVNRDGYDDVVVESAGGSGQLLYANMAGGTFQNWVGVSGAPGWTGHTEPDGGSVPTAVSMLDPGPTADEAPTPVTMFDPGPQAGIVPAPADVTDPAAIVAPAFTSLSLQRP